jgi:hypothetical protein
MQVYLMTTGPNALYWEIDFEMFQRRIKRTSQLCPLSVRAFLIKIRNKKMKKGKS